MIVDVIGQAIDVGDIEVVQVLGKEKKKLELTLSDSGLPTNELALSTVTREVVKPRGNKRQIDKWSLYPERSVLDVIMATEVSVISIESDDNTYLSSTPLSKRRVESDMDDLSSTSKKQCSKIIKLEKNNA
ncbi:hypothetical protein Bca4012_084271 [Brassica carinata]